MKILAILEVDEDEIKSISDFESEMGRVSQSGITMKKHWDARKAGEYEYAAFCWNTETKEYEQMGRPVANEMLCRMRYAEYAEKEWFNKRYDTSKVIFRKRLAFAVCEDWKRIEEGEI